MKTPLLILSFPLLLACDQTEECRKLELIELDYQRALSAAKARVALKAQSEKRLTQREQAAKKKLAELGLDLPETKLQEELDARIAQIPGATIERTTRPVSDLGILGAASGAHETLWRIQFTAKNDAEAFDRMRMLTKEPPIFSLATLQKGEKGKWLLELMRASVLEVPLNVDPTPLPNPASPSEVESELGFCGAGDIRERIEKLEKEWSELKTQAEELSVIMPKVASYEGLERRAVLLDEIEEENRRLIEMFLSAVQKQKLSFRAAGVERALVIYELHGGDRERGKLEKALPPDAVQGLKQLESGAKNVVRLSVVNRVADQQVKRSGAMKPGVGLAPEKHPGHQH